jgi:hypothetical protein
MKSKTTTRSKSNIPKQTKLTRVKVGSINIQAESKPIVEQNYEQGLTIPKDPFQRVLFANSILTKTKAYYDSTPKPESLEDLIPFISGYSTELLDIHALIYSWITYNIVYDLEGKNSGNKLPNDPESVFKNKKCVCEGYASLYLYISEKLGLNVLKVSGTAKQSTFKAGDKLSSNHAWNVIEYRKERYLIDSTWGTGYSSEGKYVVQFTPVYFLIHPDILADSHFPDKPEYLLTKKGVSLSAFNKTLRKNYSGFYENMIKYGFTNVSHSWPEVSVDTATFCIKFTVDNAIEYDNKKFFWEVCKGNTKLNDVISEHKDGEWIIKINFSEKGEHMLKLCEIIEESSTGRRYNLKPMHVINANIIKSRVGKVVSKPKPTVVGSTGDRAKSLQKVTNLKSKLVNPK